jgi:tetratricopeptide (TPR) repeat protein
VAHRLLGITLLRKGQDEAATTALRRATDLKPDDALAHFNLGVALGEQGRLAEAAAAYRRVIELQPAYAEAHCNLGDVLQRQGEFAQALTAFRQGHALGSRRRDWPYPSARWVEECQRLCELEGRLPALLSGQVQPRTAAERRDYAQLCTCKKRYHMAARLWAEALTAEPKLAEDLEASPRYDAACVAALAGCGVGADAGPLGDAERARWRQRAVAWLRAELAVYGKRLEGGTSGDRQWVCQRLRHWQRDPDLAGLRDPAAVATLPVAEQQQCRQLWADVQARLARAGEPAAAGREAQ